jgi:hypothetical protein
MLIFTVRQRRLLSVDRTPVGHYPRPRVPAAASTATIMALDRPCASGVIDDIGSAELECFMRVLGATNFPQ